MPATLRLAGLAPKYALWIVALVATLLIASGSINLYISWRENEAHIDALQVEKARGAAARIQQYIADIEQQVGWTLLPPTPLTGAGATAVDPLQLRRLEFLKLLRQAPAITHAAWIDPQGLEQVRVSRLVPDAVGQAVPRQAEAAFTQTTDGRTWRSAVTFRKFTEPYLRVARRSAASGGVTVADINLKFVWEVVSALQLGSGGVAYVVDDQGTLVAHPDISLVLKKADLTGLPQVRDAVQRLANSAATASAGVTVSTPSAAGTHADAAGGDDAVDPAGRRVLAAAARIEPLGWTVLVESPRSEALAPVVSSAWRLSLLLVAGLALSALASALLARTLVRPIRALQDGAERIGAGDLEHRIQVTTRDELRALAERFNQMAASLQTSVGQLESRVAERTRELAEANEAKSRFLAAASHDLRQPVHALGLFVGQLRGAGVESERQDLLAHIEHSVASFEGLLEALLDMSRLDAGAVPVRRQALTLAPMLEHLVRGQAATAGRKGLRLGLRLSEGLRSGHIGVVSDPVLLERMLTNLLTNAVRYTAQGGVLLTAREREGEVELRVLDSGVGIAPDQLPHVFREFYRVPGLAAGDDPGLGLGLAIVRRLTDLLGHRLDVRSAPGRGSVFTLRLPRVSGEAVPEATGMASTDNATSAASDLLTGRRVLVIDDDAAVRQAMRGQLQQWGVVVQVVADEAQALAALVQSAVPEAILCDLRLADGVSGLDLALRLREHHSVPTAIVTGETSVEQVRAVREAGLALLSKPVRPARLRAQLEAMLGDPAPH
jgi:signal transduction histidine kinase